VIIYKHGDQRDENTAGGAGRIVGNRRKDDNTEQGSVADASCFRRTLFEDACPDEQHEGAAWRSGQIFVQWADNEFAG